MDTTLKVTFISIQRQVSVDDTIQVPANGDIYLEVADATHYRIDKISFAQK
jgi:hypothetical protein